MSRTSNDFVVSIKCDNAAFANAPAPEVARILRRLADTLLENGLKYSYDFTLHDLNGNTVGHAYFDKRWADD